MNKNFYIYPLIVVTVSVIGYIIFNTPDSEIKPLPLTKKIASQPISTNLTQKPQLTQPAKVSESTDFEINESLDEIDDVFPSGISKTSTKAKEVLEQAGLIPKDISKEAYVEFDLETLRNLEVGDTFDLEIPQTLETFSAEVTSTQEFNNGDKSVFGRLVGSDGVMHTTVLTVGKDALYGQLTAPSGNYVFETKDRFGWIAAKRDLYRSHVEYVAEEVTPGATAPVIELVDKGSSIDEQN